MVLNPHGQDIKLDSLKMSAAFKFIIMLQNIIITHYGLSGKSQYYCELTELNVMTISIWYCVNGSDILFLAEFVQCCSFIIYNIAHCPFQ